MSNVIGFNPADGTTVQYYANTRFTATYDGSPDDGALLTTVYVCDSAKTKIGSMGFYKSYGDNTASVTVNPSEIPLYSGYAESDAAYLLIGLGGDKYYPLIRYTVCGAPTVCKLDRTISHENAVLSWSGATAGTANAVTGYEVQRAESVDGVSFGAWATIATPTAAALSVAPPATYGNYYRFRVRTRGAAGSAYYSAWKTCANTLRRDHAPLEGFTDSPLVAGTTPVKALHMLELQSRVNTLRAFYGLSAYAFSPIDARGIAGWTDHVKEIRTALDEIGKEHDAWIDIPVNRPRADVLEQLRAVVLAT